MAPAAQQNSWQLGVPYTFDLNGVPFWTQPGGPGTQVFPAIEQGEVWPDWPGAAVMVYSYVPWVQPGCLHPIHEFKILQEYDFVEGQPVQLICCQACQYVQRAVYGDGENGMPVLYDPLLYAVIVG